MTGNQRFWSVVLILLLGPIVCGVIIGLSEMTEDEYNDAYTKLKQAATQERHVGQ
jgi:hypothetical protein